MNKQEERIDLLIRYFEGNLTSSEAQKVAKRLENDEGWQKEWDRIKRTRIRPDNTTTYPWKSHLKKKSIPLMRKRSMIWTYGIAASICLFFFIGQGNLIKWDAPKHSQETSLKQGKKVVPWERLPLKSFNSGEVKALKTPPEKAKKLSAAKDFRFEKKLNGKAEKGVKSKQIEKMLLYKTGKEAITLNKKPPELVKKASMEKVLTGLENTRKISQPGKDPNQKPGKDFVKNLAVKVFDLEKTNPKSSLYKFEWDSRKFKISGKISMD